MPIKWLLYVSAHLISSTSYSIIRNGLLNGKDILFLSKYSFGNPEYPVFREIFKVEILRVYNGSIRKVR